MTVAQDERAGLVAELRRLGPDAPTLCEGWTTRDMAAHLVVRERRLDASAGIMVPFLAGYTERVQHQVAAETDWEDLVDKTASGPPVYSPFKLLDPIANPAEMFIHHEDIRRAQPGWQPRDLDPATAKALRAPLGLMARLTLRKAPATVVLTAPDGQELGRAGRGPQLRVTGDPGELLLFVTGRDEAQVEFDGPADLVERVKKSRGGL
jgi:uncharacterized protein (TIGR03085 family)